MATESIFAGEANYDAWLTILEEDVIQSDYGYEPGEFTVYPSEWRELYDEGLTPQQAWQRALDAFADARREDDEKQAANFARIQAEDAATIAHYRRHEKSSCHSPK